MSECDEKKVAPPRIFSEGGSWLIWTVNEVEEIYNTTHIVGSATMTAPHYPKQTSELSLPFELMPCEVKWCYENNFCTLCAIKANFDLESVPASQLPQMFDQQIQIDDDSEYEILTVDPPEVDPLLYQTYCILKQSGYWIYNGQNYGCDFTIYQNEPWKCHSYALVWCEEKFLNTRKLIHHIRISESTKKNAIAAIQSDDGSVKLVQFFRYKSKDDKDDEEVVIEDDDDTHFL